MSTSDPPQFARHRRTASQRVRHALRPLPWIGPCIALVAVIVLWPVVVLFETSFQRLSFVDTVLGGAGFANYVALWHQPGLTGVVVRTVVWVVAVVGVTILVSLALAQLFNQRFPLRRVARTALILPWAASVVMTALIFKWALQPDTGAINIILHALGLGQLSLTTGDWLGNPTWAFIWMIVVAIFVSVPFTTYVLIAGLQTIADEVYEAARVDGARAWRCYRLITLPLLKPAILVACVINLINVFNSFPIIWEMTGGGPGYQTANSTVFMYQLDSAAQGQSASLSVFNFLAVIVVVIIFLKVTGWREAVS